MFQFCGLKPCNFCSVATNELHVSLRKMVGVLFMSKGRKSYVKRRTETEVRGNENLSGSAVLTTKELL